MASIHKDIPIDAPADDVWDAVRDFGARASTAGAGLCHRLPARRRRTHRDLRQRQRGAEDFVDCDDARRRLVYAILAANA